MLAIITKMTPTQVSTWLANARRRPQEGEQDDRAAGAAPTRRATLMGASARRKTRRRMKKTASANWSWRRRSQGRSEDTGARAWRTTMKTRRSIWRT